MKKALVIMMLVIAAPLYAVTGTVDNSTNGECTITIPTEIVALGLSVVCTAGVIDADGVVIDSFFDVYMDFAQDEEVSGDGYQYLEATGTPIANKDAVGPATLPSASFAISAGGLDDTGSEVVPTTVTITLTSAAGATGTINTNALRGGLVDATGAPVALDEIAFTINPAGEPECVKSDAPFYNEWLGSDYAGTPTAKWASPACWCYERQCRGDVNGAKVSIFWVQGADLTVFADAFNKGPAMMSQARICADLDHKKVSIFRVQGNDLTIFAQYFNKGPAMNPVCPMDWDADGDDDYNFWVTP